MITVPIEVVGETGGHKSRQFDSGLTRNMYLDVSANRKGVHDFPGLRTLATASGKDRGSHAYIGSLFRVIGPNLYRYSRNGSYTNVGTIPGNDYCVFEDDGESLYIVGGGRITKYLAGTITTVSQTVITYPTSIAYLNRQFIITEKDSGIFAVSDVADGDTYNALNYAEAETEPDYLRRAYSFNQVLYLIGRGTTEVWYNSGVGNPPFDRQDTALINIGAAGHYCVTNTDSYMYWLGNDRKIYQCIGSSARPVNTQPISHKLEALTTYDDCVASAFVHEGQDFVMFSFPTEGETYVFSETYNYWIELSAGTDLVTQQWYGSQVFALHDTNIVTGHNGKVYELDPDTYTDDSATRLRIRELPVINGKSIDKPNARITVSQVRINMEIGVGLLTGQGSDPVIMCQMSPDGGHTWQAQSHVSIGENGEYILPVDFWDFCTGYDIRVRIMCTDPVYLSMFDGYAVVEEAGY